MWQFSAEKEEKRDNWEALSQEIGIKWTPCIDFEIIAKIYLLLSQPMYLMHMDYLFRKSEIPEKNKLSEETNFNTGLIT